MYVKVLDSVGEIIHSGNRKIAPFLVSRICGYQIGFIGTKIDFCGYERKNMCLNT